MLLGILLAFLILVCLALGGVVLLQRSEGGALGMGGGPSGFLTTRGAGDLLTRTTWVLGAVFFVLCLALTILQGRLHKGTSVVDRLKIDPLSSDALSQGRQPFVPPPAAAPTTNATGFEAPAPQVNAAPATAGSAAAPSAVAGRRPVAPTAGAGAGAAVPPPQVHVTRAPAGQATPAPTPSSPTPAQGSTPPDTNTGPTNPGAAMVGGTPGSTSAPAPKANTTGG